MQIKSSKPANISCNIFQLQHGIYPEESNLKAIKTLPAEQPDFDMLTFLKAG